MLSKLTLYGRENCHLCHDMLQDLRLLQTRLKFKLDIDVIDIDESELLQQRFGVMIPVLTSESGEVICSGRLSHEVLLAHLQRHGVV